MKQLLQVPAVFKQADLDSAVQLGEAVQFTPLIVVATCRRYEKNEEDEKNKKNKKDEKIKKMKKMDIRVRILEVC